MAPRAPPSRRPTNTTAATSSSSVAARASSNAAAAAAAGSATSMQASAPGSTTTVSIQFDNGADAEGTGATLLTVDAPGADDLLAEATGVLDALGLRVQSASIRREGEGGGNGNGNGSIGGIGVCGVWIVVDGRRLAAVEQRRHRRWRLWL